MVINMIVNNAIKPMTDSGLRFILFRKALNKSRDDLSKELCTTTKDIEAIENGTIAPKINFLHYLYMYYGLNLNWIICGNGDMFIDDRQLKLNPEYVPQSSEIFIENFRERYNDLIRFMQIPVIEKQIMNSIQEIKTQLRIDS